MSIWLNNHSFNNINYKLHNIRLSEKEISTICELFKDSFKEDDHLWLFGSRTDPNKKGGDIDLYIETSITDASLILEAKIKFSANIKLAIGDQKIDIVIKYNDTEMPIYKIARKEGILLA